MEALETKNIATDAVSMAFDSSDGHKTAKEPITVETIENLEKEMDIFEKISLVFLLYPEVELAFQRLQAVEASLMSSNMSFLSEICLLSDWARSARSEKDDHCSQIGISVENQLAFVEAVCVIQDFKSLMRIGRGDRCSGLSTRDMSLKTPEKFFVNHTRNVLYRLCEGLSPPRAMKLIHQIEQERPDLERAFPTDPRLLEIVLLHWAIHEFIQISDSSKVDVRNLSRHLQMMGEFDLAEMLDFHCPYPASRRKFTTISKGVEYNHLLPQLSSPDVERASLSIAFDDHNANMETLKISAPLERPDQVTAKTTSRRRMEAYSLDPKCMGVCLIVNQKNFHREKNPNLIRYLPEKPLEDRVGTDVDRDRLIEAFTSLGFNVKVESNLTHSGLLALVRSVATNIIKEKHSSFAFCILSHGQKDVVYGCNSIPVEIMELVETFCGSKCPALIDKPKTFIFQACQGSKLQKSPLDNIALDGPSKTLSGVKDYVKFLSTVPGYASLRHKVTGSWFIEHLSEEIMCRDSGSSLLDVFTLVNASLDKKSSVSSNSVISMMSELHSTLRGPVMLPYDPEAMKKASLFCMQRVLFDLLFEEYFSSPDKCKYVLTGLE